MIVRKIKNAPFHNANKLNGTASRATYGIFDNGVQVGFVCGNPLWEAYSMDGKTRLLSFPCVSLSELKKQLHGITR